jgi:hypothetical protein
VRIALVFLVLLTACGRDAGGGGSPPAAADTGGAAAPDIRAAWTASATAVGPVRIGMTVAQAERALGSPFEPSSDSGECVYRKSAAAPPGVLFMQVGGRIVRIDITEPRVRTANGIEVGSSERDVRAAYGSAIAISPHKYTAGRYLTVADDADHRVVFETGEERVTRYRAGRLPEVEWVEGCA